MSEFDPTEHMMKLSGKEYLPVAARIVWLRQEYPQAIIRTTLVEWNQQEEYAVFRAEVTLPDGGHAEATAVQSKRDFKLYLEKCETKAIGRALGFLGYGTMAAFEDEPDNPVVADTPVARSTPRPSRPAPAPAASAPQPSGSPNVEAVLTKLQEMDDAKEPWSAIKKYADEEAAKHVEGDDQLRILDKLKAIANRRRAIQPPPSNAG